MRRLWIPILFLMAGIGLVPPASAQWADGPAYVFRVHVTDRDRQIPILAGMGLDLAGVDVKASTADFAGDEETYQRLKDAGFEPEIVWTPTVSAIEALSDYLDPAEVSTRLDTYQSSYPALAKKISLGTTLGGRTVWAMKISDNVNAEEDEPAVFFVGQHHAREVMTPEITMDIIDYLLTRYATDTRVQAWVDGREIWVVVSENPDGASYVFTNSSGWRKNRRNNGDGTFGVDPNRNYTYRWGFCNGSSSQTSDDTYRGPSAGSELETQAYTSLAMTQRPVASLSYHTYSELVLHPPGCANVFTPENRMFRDLTSDIATRLPNDTGDGWYSNGTPWELLYSVDGDSDAWFYATLGTAAITIEANAASQGFLPDYATWRNVTVARNRPGWQYVLDRPDASSIWGHVTDACTGAPLTATIALDEIVFSAGESPRASESGFGRYQWLTTPGLWHLTVSKPGYQTQSWAEEVAFDAVQKEVALVPTASFAAEVRSWTIADAGPGGDGDGAVDPGESVTMHVRATATGGALSGLTAVLTTSDPYVSITASSSSWPPIAAGGSMDPIAPFAFSVSPQTPDGHVVTFQVAFSASQPLCAAGEQGTTIEVPVTIGASACPAISEPLDANPGWTIQNSDSLGWAFGPPVGGGGNNGPTSGHTGTKVYGTNLSGAYGNSADYKLITTPFNLTGVRGAELRFWRYLNTEAGYDLASVDLSTDGTNFTNVWSGFGRDTQWESYRFDISALADGRATVYVRFRLISDGSTTASGFYIDDVSICGEALPPAPSLEITSTTFDDGQNGACTDHDAYADRGETVLLTVHYKNQGTATATGAIATLSSSDPRIAMIDFRAALGDVPPAGTGTAVYRFRVASTAACNEPAPFLVEFSANGASYRETDPSISLTLHADDGAPIPNTFENFEAGGGWTLTGEWQIGAPQAKGGTTGGGSGAPDPPSAFSGTKALGIDLTGLGSSQGNYENNLSAGITATSPTYNCSHVSNVQVSFKRWLGVEQSQYDKATVHAWNGSAWQTVWMNPNANLSDAAWQSVSYDVTPYAAGRSDFRVRFGMTSDSAIVYSGWTIDDLTVTNGYVPQNCEAGSCAAGCTPASQLSGPVVTSPAGVTTLGWAPSASACHDTGGAGYRVYRAPSPRPRVPAPASWPADGYFIDVTTRDLDGSSANPSYKDGESPLAGFAFFYLVVDMGTSGAEGPKGWQGF